MIEWGQNPFIGSPLLDVHTKRCGLNPSSDPIFIVNSPKQSLMSEEFKMSPVHKKVLIWSSGIVLVVSLALIKFSNSGPKSEPFLRFKDYKVLAEGGDAQSQWFLGSYYFSGKDAPKNLALSSYWFRKSAEKNHTEACYDLGIHYMEGVGVETNYLNAAFWLQKAIFSTRPPAASATVSFGPVAVSPATSAVRSTVPPL